MRLLAKADVVENNKKHKAGTEFETDKATGLALIEFGWAAEIKEKQPAKKPAKKTKE